ncbi:MAG: M16 family metallopeptidase [Myxococcota bacterium]
MRADLRPLPVHRETLDNGLRVVVAPLPHLHTATVGLFVQAGSRHEDAASNGLSHLLEHMLFRGTATHPTAYRLNLAVERLGGTLYGATHTDFTTYQVSVPPDNVAPVIGVMADMVHAPLFNDLEVEKRVLREEILEDLDEEGNEIDADNLVRDLMFAPHPLGFKITGSLDNIRRFTVDDVRAHFERFYGARNMVLCLAGAVGTEMLEAVRRAFGRLLPGAPARVEPPAVAGTRRFVAVHDDGSQTDVRLSYPCPGLHDPRYTAVQLLGRVLDDGLSSRLHRRICDERGLAYDAFAALEAYEDCGAVDLGASVEHQKAPEVLGALLELVRDLAREPVPDEELHRVRRRYLWDLEAMVDDAEGVASFYGTNVLFGLHDTIESTAATVAAATPADLQEAARTVFDPERAHVACVGVLERARIPEVRALINNHPG